MQAFVIAQFSDTHICAPSKLLFNGVDSNANLVRAVQSILNSTPKVDALLITGDLCQSGTLDEYQNLRVILDPLIGRIPVYFCLGNHDERFNFCKVFKDYPGFEQYVDSKSLQYSVQLGGYRLVVLDSLLHGSDYGHLHVQELDWLDQTLKRYSSAQPIIVAVHHPMISSGNSLMDQMNLKQTQQLEISLSRAKNLSLIVCGHLHRLVVGQFAGAPVIVCPSTAHAYAVDLTKQNAHIVPPDQPGYLLHIQNGTGELISTVKALC
jgi:3',5'-cyclic AMP phosphodiesterase CpdA